MIQNESLFGKRTLNKKYRIRTFENLICLIPVRSSHPFSTLTEKIKPEFDQNELKKNLHSI